jgi:hypothetical protein
MAKLKNQIIPVERVENKIYVVRGQRVMLDSDLAEIYGVATSRLNEQVKRNLIRFPEDFMFQLTKKELENWMSQFATSNPGAKKGLRKLPRAFTEHGAVMLASVLSSPTAVNASILVVRAFVQMRRVAALNADLAQRIAKLEAKYGEHDGKMKGIIKIFKDLLEIEPPPEKENPPKEPIGFRV